MAVNFKKLVEGVKAHGDKAVGGLKTALADRALRPSELDLGKLFVECFGWSEFQAAREHKRAVHKVFEAAGAVSSDAFLNITQQFAYQAILDAYDIPDRVFTKLIPTRASKFKWERVPGVSHVGDEALVVEEGKEFPEAAVSEDWTDTAETRKRGMKIPITKEAVFFDQTNLVLDRCRLVGDWLGVNKEKRAIDCVIDYGESAQNQYRYRWRNSVIQTYGDNSGTHTWDNLAATNGLVSYANVEAAWKLLAEITDPYTGEPQNVSMKHIVVPPDLAWAVPFALKGMVKKVSPGYATSGNPVSTEVENPVADIIGQLQTVSTQLLKSRSGSDTTWWVGDLAAAFEYVENWPIQVLNLGAGSHDEFHRDIVMQFRADERGTFNTKNPRKMIKNTA